MIEADPEFPAAASAKDLKLYERRMRQRAYDRLLEQEHELARAAQTQADFTERLTAAEASIYTKAVLERARTSLTSDRNRVVPAEQSIFPTDHNNTFSAATVNFDQDFDEDEEIEAEPDNDMWESDQEYMTVLDNATEERETDAEYDAELSQGTNEDLPYVDQVRAFMEILWEGSLREGVMWKDQLDKGCPLCQIDDTADEAHKVRHNHLLLS